MADQNANELLNTTEAHIREDNAPVKDLEALGVVFRIFARRGRQLLEMQRGLADDPATQTTPLSSEVEDVRTTTS